MPKLPAAQRGMSMSFILFVIVIAIFVVTVAFKLGPIYMHFLTMKSIMNGVAESSMSVEPIIGGKPTIVRVLENRMMINDVRDIDAKSFTVKKTGEESFEVTLDYERREHLFFNIDAVLMFKYTVTVKGR